MDWGMKNRLSRIIQPNSGRTVMLAVDHGYFLGPTEGLEVPKRTLEPLLAYADSLMLTRGVLRTSVLPEKAPAIVLRVSGGTSILSELSNEIITTSVQDAIRLNASAITCSVFIGSAHEKETIANLGRLINEGEQNGIPVLAVTAVGKEMVRDARYLSLACRICAELGAHFVKTYYCEDFERVVETCPVPIVIAGGKKISERDALKLSHDAVTRGAVGVDMGRNVFQSEAPAAMIQAVRQIVHQNASVEEAFEFYNSLKGSAKRPASSKVSAQKFD